MEENQHLALIENRLTRIERYLNMSTLVAPTQQKTLSEPITPIQNEQQNSLFPEFFTMPKPGSWLGIIAVFCFILAAGLIIKLSIDSGWLTPLRQAGLAVLLGLGLIGTGLALLKSDRGYAAYLPGGGIVILYLTAFAAHRYYHLLSFNEALAAVAVVSAFCIFLHSRIRHDLYPLTAALGAYIAPVLLDLQVEATFSIYYFYFCSIAFAIISIFLRSRLLILVSTYLAVVLTAIVGLDLNMDGLIACVLVLHFVLFAAASLFYSLSVGPALTQDEALCFLPILLIFYAAEYHYVNLIQPQWAPWIAIGLAVVLNGFYLIGKRYIAGSLASQSLVFFFLTLVGFHAVYLELLPDVFKPWLFVMIICAAAFWPGASNATKNPAWFLPKAALLIIVAIEYVTMLHHLIMPHTEISWLSVSALSVISMWALISSPEHSTKYPYEAGQILLGAAHIMAITGLYRLADPAGSLAVSASWLFYAVLVLGFAFHRKDEIMAKSALFVLGFAAAKALLYDAAAAPTVVRIFCLLLTGAVLYGCGLFMRRIAGWQRATELSQNKQL